MGNRHQNEKKYETWTELANGGRTYTRRVDGKHGWFALYHKTVSESEETLAFWQEIFDAQGKMVEIHEKFPVDKGHQSV